MVVSAKFRFAVSVECKTRSLNFEQAIKALKASLLSFLSILELIEFSGDNNFIVNAPNPAKENNAVILLAKMQIPIRRRSVELNLRTFYGCILHEKDRQCFVCF